MIEHLISAESTAHKDLLQALGGTHKLEPSVISIALTTGLLAVVLVRSLRRFIVVAAQLEAGLDALATAVLAEPGVPDANHAVPLQEALPQGPETDPTEGA